jgi:hypothetical protein
MKWIWNRRHETTDEDTASLNEAQSVRKLAEEKLQEAIDAARQVRDVAIEARRIRRENQFSQRLSDVFGSRPNHNG